MRRGRSRPLRLGAVAWTQTRRHWPASVAIAVGIATTVALAAAVVLVQAITAETGLRDTIGGLGPQAYVRVDERRVVSSQAYETFGETRPQQVAADLGPLVRQRALRAETDPVQSVPAPGAAQAAGVARLALLPGLEQHSRIVSGQQPAADRTDDTWNVTASEEAVSGLRLDLGRRYCFETLGDRPGPGFCARLSGVWRALRADDPYWGGLPPPDSALTVGPAAFFAVLRTLRETPQVAATATVLFEPDLAGFHQSNAADALARFRRLRSDLALRTAGDSMTTGLDGALQAFEDRLQLASFAIELIGAQLVLLALFFVAFVSGHALRLQRQTFAVWRSRGWSWHAVWRLLLVQSLLLAMPAVPAGAGLGWLAAAGSTRLVYGGAAGAPPVAPEAIGLAVALAAAAAILVLAAQSLLASRHDLLAVRREASRPARRGWWQWRWADVALAAVSVPLLATTRLHGQGQVRAGGTAGDDPVGLLAPGLALAVLGVALLRLLPVTGALSGLGRRSTAWSLAALQLTRRPVEHAGLALLLIVATAVGVFAGVYASTAPRAAADRAAYAAGADLRVHFEGLPPTAGVAGLRGVEAASYVLRTGGSTQVGSTFQPTVLGVDPYSFRRVIWSRPDLAARPVADLLQELADREQGGLLLPGRPRRIGIWAYGTGAVARIGADLSDSAGRPGRADLGSTDFSGWRYLEAAIALPAGPVQYPLRFRDLAVQSPAAGAPAEAPGRVGLAELGVSGSDGAPPTVVERFSPGERNGTIDWWRVPAGRDGIRLAASPAFQHDGLPALDLALDPGGRVVVLRPPPSRWPVPALASSRTLERAGVRAGQAFSMVVDSVVVEMVVVAAVDHFPTLYPESQDFLIAAQAPLLAVLGHDGGETASPSEAWLAVRPASDQADLAVLAGRPDVTSVDDRRQAEAAALRDPLLRSLEANLLLGFVAALALAAAGVIVHFLVGTRARLGECAILLANGLSRRLLLRSLAIEQGLLTLFGVVAGVGTGLALAWVLVPELQLGSDLSASVPPTVLTLDPGLLLGAVAAMVLVTLLGGRLASRLGSRLRLLDELRLLG